LTNLRNSQFSKCEKNNECVRTWANGTSYTSKGLSRSEKTLGGLEGEDGWFFCLLWVGGWW
jgi:hypothetical protein